MPRWKSASAGGQTAARVSLLDETGLATADRSSGAFLVRGQEIVAAQPRGLKVTLTAYALACIDLP
jgi:hypothetical protein